LVVLGGLALTGTRGGQEYFSPYTLELTTQSEFTLLSGKLPLYKSTPCPVDNSLVNYVRAAGIVESEKPINDRQVLVFHWNRAWWDGDGELHRVFHSHRDEIIEWCKEDPDRAKMYWSEGMRHLRSSNPSEVAIGEFILGQCWWAKSIDELKQQIASIER